MTLRLRICGWRSVEAAAVSYAPGMHFSKGNYHACILARAIIMLFVRQLRDNFITISSQFQLRDNGWLAMNKRSEAAPFGYCIILLGRISIPKLTTVFFPPIKRKSLN